MKKIDMINELEKNREYVENIINSKNNKFTFRNHNYNYSLKDIDIIPYYHDFLNI